MSEEEYLMHMAIADRLREAERLRPAARRSGHARHWAAT